MLLSIFTFLFLMLGQSLSAAPDDLDLFEPNAIQAEETNTKKSARCSTRIWRKGNDAHYQRLKAAQFRAHIKEKGLHRFADYKTRYVQELLGLGERQLNNGILVPQSVMVIGGGIGRDCAYLRKYTNIPNIHVVEVAPKNYMHLLYEFGRGSEIAEQRRRQGRPEQKFIIEGQNIRDLWGKPTIDVAFWMFAGVLELSPWEKWRAIENLYSMLRPGASLVVDLPLGPSTFDIIPDSDVQLLRMGAESLRLHPFIHNSTEVDVDKLVHMFERKKYFTKVDHYEYHVDTKPRGKRQMLVFRRI